MLCTGKVFRPASFVNRFRVCARKLIYFQKRIAKLGPMYLSCNEKQTGCTRTKADPRKGCTDCEFTIQYKIFIKELEEELKHVKNGTRKGARKWPSKYLLDQLVEVATISYSTKRKSPKWTVIVNMLISVYRDEIAKMRAIDNYTPDKEAQVPAISKLNIRGNEDGDAGDN